MNKILVVMSDIFFSAKINDAAKKLGTTIAVVQNEAKFNELLQAPPPVVILDLNCATVDPVQLILQIKANPATKSIPVIGFYSHVQVQSGERAAAAGCDVVVRRSVFTDSVPQLLARFIPATPDPSVG